MWKDYLTLHFIIIIWGFTAILGKESGLPAPELVFYRTGIAAVVLAIWLVWQRKTIRLGKRTMRGMFLTGMLVGLHWTLFFAAIYYSNVSLCLAGIATSTLWTSFTEPIMMRRKILWYEVLLGVLIIYGLQIILRAEFDHVLGLILAVGAALLAAIFAVINARYAKKYDPYVISFWQMSGAWVFCALFLPIYAYFFAENQTLQFNTTTWGWGAILILSLVCTVYAYSLAVKIMQRITAFTMNLSVNMEPIYGTIMAAILYQEHEQLTPDFYVGTSIVFASVLVYPILQRYDVRRKLKAKSV